jgi:hypothetical protein
MVSQQLASRLLGAVALATSACAAHLPRADERSAFLERSTVQVSSDRHQAFEAQPSLHLLLRNGLDETRIEDEGGYAATVSASFLGTLRMWRDASTPVRTPTYEPRLMLQLFRAATLGDPGELGQPDPRHRMLTALQLAIGHRSNGEEGCALADHVRVGDRNDFDCVPVTDPPVRALNVRDGSFTTNYASAELLARWTGPGARDGGALAATGGGGAEWNLPCHFGACMPTAMRERYGPVRATWTAELEAPVAALLPLPGPGRALRLRVGAPGSVRMGGSAGHRWEVSPEVAVVGRRAGGMEAGVFVRRHLGSDYLNIHFEERLDAWIVGIVLDPSPPSGP